MTLICVLLLSMSAAEFLALGCGAEEQVGYQTLSVRYLACLELALDLCCECGGGSIDHTQESIRDLAGCAVFAQHRG